MNLELKRDRLIFRARGQIWEWGIEPKYWRNPLIYVGLLIIFPVIAYFAQPTILPTFVNANLLAAIAIPLFWMTIGTGRINFGPQFYVGVGGYTAALLSIHLGLSPALTFIITALVGLAFGFAMSPLSIISGGLYYSLLTLIFPLVFLEITFIYTDIFKGDVGLFGVAPLVNLGSITMNYLVLAFASMAMMLIYMYIVDKIMRSRYALEMAAINDDEGVANASGVNVNKIKIITFAFPAMMISIVGWFYAHYYGTFAGITYLPLAFMLKILMVMMIGGRVQTYGCVIGGYFIAFLEMILIRIIPDISAVVFPIVLLVCLLTLAPEGLLGLYRKRHYREYMPTLHVRR
jgi:branched-chain amino acid transport system permease protein